MEFNKCKIKNEINSLLDSGEYDLIHYNSSCSSLGMIKDYVCLRQAKKSVKIFLACKKTHNDRCQYGFNQ